mgnify:CR=1 FL=1
MKLIPIYSWNKTVIKFNSRTNRISKQPWFQGVLLLICVIAAMLLANLPATQHLYHDILNTNLQLHVFNESGDIAFPREMTVEKFINDILMVIFFFTVGLEIKREIADGELSTPRKALMPVIAAFGGVIAPALIFAIINGGTQAFGGWGIPTATDIAFAVCILSVLGDKVPVSLKVFLTALAIADDLIAILVVALFYGGAINFTLLGISFFIIFLTIIMRRMGEKRMFPYLLMAILVWGLFYYSGIHATMSGVVMAFLIPSAPRFSKIQYYHKRELYNSKIDALDSIDNENFPNGPQKHYLRAMADTEKGVMDLSYRAEHTLSSWVNFINSSAVNVSMNVFFLSDFRFTMTYWRENAIKLRFSSKYGYNTSPFLRLNTLHRIRNFESKPYRGASSSDSTMCQYSATSHSDIIVFAISLFMLSVLASANTDFRAETMSIVFVSSVLRFTGLPNRNDAALLTISF